MAVLTLTYDTGNVAVSRITDALALGHGWTAESPLTKAQFAREVVRQMIIREVRDYEREQAKDAASSTITEVTLT